MTWRNRSACLDENPELFFPIGNAHPALLQIEEAKAVCGRCAVVRTCLSWAIESGQDAGVWGGLSEGERHALKRRDTRIRNAGRVDPSLREGSDESPDPRLGTAGLPGQVQSAGVLV